MRFHALSVLGVGSALLNVAFAATIPALEARDAANDTILPEISAFVESLSLDTGTAAEVMLKLNDSAVDLNLTDTLPPAKLRKRDNPLATTLACWILQLKFQQKFSESGSGSYTTLSTMNWSKTCWLQSKCIISPTSALDVSITMKVVTFLNVKFAMRSGGHTPNPGYANSDGGVLIELSQIRTLSLSSDGLVASIGPGLKWVEVYDYLAQHGTTVLGGRIPQVGVGGLLLGGGISFFANQYGLACDQVKNFEVVLADSRIVNANTVDNPNLYWALKGGSSNFGIVTRFDMYTRADVHNIWYELRIYSPDQTPALLDAVENFQNNGEVADKKASFVFSATTSYTLVGYVYSSPVTSVPAAFSAFYAIPPLGNYAAATVGTHYSLVSSLAGAFSPIPARHDYRAASTGVSAAMYKEVYAFWNTQALAINAATGGDASMSFSIQSLSKSAADYGYDHGGNTLGLARQTQQWFTMLIDWNNVANDAAVRAAGKSVTDKWSQVSNSMGLGNPFLYTNDASRDQNPLATYPTANIQRMKTISTTYDPNKVFQTLQGDGYLLSKVP